MLNKSLTKIHATILAAKRLYIEWKQEKKKKNKGSAFFGSLWQS
jgi:hypothetical protein